MKKLFIILLTVCVFSSCDDERPCPNKVEGQTAYTSLITLTVNGESHEFVKYSSGKYNNGISHWPGCKYCKKNNNN